MVRYLRTDERVPEFSELNLLLGLSNIILQNKFKCPWQISVSFKYLKNLGTFLESQVWNPF